MNVAQTDVKEEAYTKMRPAQLEEVYIRPTYLWLCLDR
jgi:hypothetical protein